MRFAAVLNELRSSVPTYLALVKYNLPRVEGGGFTVAPTPRRRGSPWPWPAATSTREPLSSSGPS
jgi:hypothetical protein